MKIFSFYYTLSHLKNDENIFIIRVLFTSKYNLFITKTSVPSDIKQRRCVKGADATIVQYGDRNRLLD